MHIISVLLSLYFQFIHRDTVQKTIQRGKMKKNNQYSRGSNLYLFINTAGFSRRAERNRTAEKHDTRYQSK